MVDFSFLIAYPLTIQRRTLGVENVLPRKESKNEQKGRKTMKKTIAFFLILAMMLAL